MNLSKALINRKVPEITLVFWLTKLLSTAMGESTSDYLVYKYNPYLAVAIGFLALAVGLYFQFKSKKYKPHIYWFAVLMVAIFGTMAADGVHIKLGVPYVTSTIVFAIMLALIFITWQRFEHNLSIHKINTRRREIFYWLTVMATFALGTAAGDLTASNFGLGYFMSGIFFFGLFLLPAIGFWYFGLNEILAFWTAYIITRPLGASFADWFAKPKSINGLGYGDGIVSLILAVLIIVLVIYMSLNKKEEKKEDPGSFKALNK